MELIDTVEGSSRTLIHLRTMFGAPQLKYRLMREQISIDLAQITP
jgi:hypothetical protein